MAKKTDSDKNPVGRPRIEFSADVLARLETYNGDSTATSLQRYLKISNVVYYRWLEEEPEFSEAVTRVKDRVDDKVESALLKRALGYNFTEITTRDEEGLDKQGQRIEKTTVTETPKHLPPDPGAAMNWLKNRRRDKWGDKLKVEVTGKHVDMVERAMEKLGIDINDT